MGSAPFHGPGERAYEYRHEYGFSSGASTPRLLAAALPCLAGIGCIYQALAATFDRRGHPPPGRLVDSEGCCLHVQTAGRGAPAVVLETGLGGMSAAWGWIWPEIAKFTTAVAYDRAGLGWSGPDSAPKTASLAARRLRAALARSCVSPPYVLVGHSMGGLFTRVFAGLFPDEVAGMVLLDAVHPDQHLRSSAIDRHMRSGFRFLRMIPLLTRLGYVRLAGLLGAWADGLPVRQAAQAAAFLSDYRHLTTTRDESLAWETICSEVRAARGLAGTPLAVVAAARDVLPGQPELQRELAALSSDSVHLAVKGADHVSLVTRREHAMAVVEAVRHVVGRAAGRTSTHPTPAVNRMADII
jgi:pimeloyl-ACP methyl ester carboxylesterase